ncbi:MAG: ATP-binding protein [Defluviitaleaceae bacterium]|nr:ATP-binding protein [Defluviitaleaceae bacterium]
MLVMFRAKNYMSFKDEVILDMRATSYVQHPSHVIPVEGTKGLLKTIAVYGPNASGKSNLISAMYFFWHYIVSQLLSAKRSILTDTAFEKIRAMNKHDPFMLSKDINNASEFEIIFIRNGEQVQYGFECTEEEVLNEWLFINDKKVFERDKKITIGKNYQKTIGMHTKCPKERLYTAILDFTLEDSNVKESVLGNFMRFILAEFKVFDEIFVDITAKTGWRSETFIDPREIVADNELREKVEKYLRAVDVGIKGFAVETVSELNGKTGNIEEKEIILTIHNVYDSDGNIAGEKNFPLGKESSGTIGFLMYIPHIVKIIENGGVFICDEMAARLHPLLFKFIVDIFASNENKKAQLIFTTHDISLLNNNQFRRDEVVFIEKNERGESNLFSLSDLKAREDASFSKDYLQGKYGAIPVINYKDIWGGEDDA